MTTTTRNATSNSNYILVPEARAFAEDERKWGAFRRDVRGYRR